MKYQAFPTPKTCTPVALAAALRAANAGPIAVLQSGDTDAQNTHSYILCGARQTVTLGANPAQQLRDAKTDLMPLPEGFPFAAGLVGYVPFGISGAIESRLADLQTAHNGRFFEPLTYVVFDHETHEMHIAGEDLPIDVHALAPVLPYAMHEIKNPFNGFDSDFTQADFEKSVTQAKGAIAAGQVFQIIVSNRFSCPMGDLDALRLYATLQQLEPTTHQFFLDFGDHAVFGASPEIQCKKDGNRLQISPIAGTRYRGSTPKQDAEMAAELQADAKENAEHDMLLDLARHDLGGISKPGTVRVEREKYLKKYRHVMHMVSDVVGEMDPTAGDEIDFFLSSFPAGTLVGAPKIRAMELIPTLEKSKRQAYGGAVGYLCDAGNVQMTIVIRSMEAGNGRLRFRCGAGIVADSVPAHEWLEVQNKGRTLAKLISSARKT